MKYTLALVILLVVAVGYSESKVTSTAAPTDAPKPEVETVTFNAAGAPTVQFEVPDMMCEEGCAAAVKEVLESQPGAVEVKVDFDKKLATVVVFDSKAAVAALVDKQFPNAKLVVAPEKPAEPVAPEAPAQPEAKDG